MRTPPTRTRLRVYGALLGVLIGLGVAVGWRVAFGERVPVHPPRSWNSLWR